MLRKLIYGAAGLGGAFLLVMLALAVKNHESAARGRFTYGHDVSSPIATWKVNDAAAERRLLQEIEHKMLSGGSYHVVPARKFVSGRYMPWQVELVVDDFALLVMQSSSDDGLHLVVKRAPTGDALEAHLILRQGIGRQSPEPGHELEAMLGEAVRVRAALGASGITAAASPA